MSISPLAPSSGLGSPLTTECKISRRISAEIVGWGLARITSSNASFCSGVKSEPYLKELMISVTFRLSSHRKTCLCTNTNKLWCHKTGSLSSPSLLLLEFASLMKWKTSASTTLYGNAYFLSKRTRINRELGPKHRKHKHEAAMSNREADVRRLHPKCRKLTTVVHTCQSH